MANGQLVRARTAVHRAVLAVSAFRYRFLQALVETLLHLRQLYPVLRPSGPRDAWLDRRKVELYDAAVIDVPRGRGTEHFLRQVVVFECQHFLLRAPGRA